ncbi:MAG: hypothetical protein WA125_16695 [Desulfosporosinus sp.]
MTNFQKLIALIKMGHYYRKAIKAIKNATKAVENGDLRLGRAIERVSNEYKKKAESFDWREGHD